MPSQPRAQACSDHCAVAIISGIEHNIAVLFAQSTSKMLFRFLDRKSDMAHLSSDGSMPSPLEHQDQQSGEAARNQY